jgi:hypothetical protein
MMPKRVSRESIEAELDADALSQLRAVVQEFKHEVIELDSIRNRSSVTQHSGGVTLYQTGCGG